jgi:hypothetical protein
MTGILGLSLGDGATYAMVASGRRHFSAPDRIRYDGLSLFVENKPFFLYSGSFHYCRCPKALWRDRFAKIREAGFNTVQTYVPWNLHEPEMPASPEDYSKVDMTELDEFLTMAAEFGLYAVVRVGPYMCGEWDTGGYPQWLISKIPKHYRGMWVRSDNPEFTRWANHWMHSVCRTVARHQIIRKPVGQPGVILVQVENEYGLIGVPLDQKKKHLQDLIEQAWKNGIAVPLFTNLAGFIIGSKATIASEVFDTIDRYPGWQLAAMGHRIKHYRTAQENAPVMAAEMQGGYFTSVEAQPTLHTDVDYYPDNISPAQINALTLYSIAHGLTALNYYMLFGGTNFDGRAGLNVATTYDYSAPIRECGGVGAKWLKVKAIGEMLKVHGPALARSLSVPVEARGAGKSILLSARRSPDGGIYIFAFNSDRSHGKIGRFIATVGPHRNMAISYRLQAGDFKIFFLPAHAAGVQHGTWLPQPQQMPDRPSEIPLEVPISFMKYRADALPSQWAVVPAGDSLADMGVYESGLSYYRARIGVMPGEKNGPAALTISLPGQDSAIAQVHGKVLYPSGGGGSPAILPVPESVSGTMEVTYLYENTGHANSGWAMQEAFGIQHTGLMPYSMEEGVISQWRMKPIQLPRHVERLAEIHASYDDASWKRIQINSTHPHQIGHRKAAVYRTSVNLTENDLRAGKTVLRMGVVSSRGWLFVNGKPMGMMGGSGSAVNMHKALHAGRNIIALVVQELGHWGGIGQAQLIHRPDAWGRQDGPLLLAGKPAGVVGGWYKPEFNDLSWSSHAIGPAKNTGGALLNWYRMNFQLPTVQKNIWVPWCLRIAAIGNGFIYLNGKAIGRFWQHGGQREFYLPDNWLNAPGKPNVIALCLRPVDQPTAITKAAVVPYRVYAEYRKT